MSTVQPVPQAVFAGDEALQKVAAIADPRARTAAAANLMKEYKALTVEARQILKASAHAAVQADPELRLWVLAAEAGVHQTTLIKGIKMPYAEAAVSPNGSGDES